MNYTMQKGIKYTVVEMLVAMQCPKTYFVRVLVLFEIYVNSFSNYHVIKVIKVLYMYNTSKITAK